MWQGPRARVHTRQTVCSDQKGTPVKKLMYAGTEILTGDDIAQALLALAGALAQTGDADTVEIPVLDADGSRTTALVLVGPASQIVAGPIRNVAFRTPSPSSTGISTVSAVFDSASTALHSSRAAAMSSPVTNSPLAYRIFFTPSVYATRSAATGALTAR
jgi:hypothetical protein